MRASSHPAQGVLPGRVSQSANGRDDDPSRNAGRRPAGRRARGVRAPRLARGVRPPGRGGRAARSAGADLESLSTAAFFSAEAQAGKRGQGARLPGVRRRGQSPAGRVPRPRHRPRARVWRAAIRWHRPGCARPSSTLEDLPESYAHGYLVLLRSELGGDGRQSRRGARPSPQQAIEIGNRVVDADLRAFAQTNLGFLKISSGDTEAGFALMEEASIAAVNDELSPVVSGITCCRMISACRDLTDYQRATEWIEATESYCKRQSVSGFPGVCRIHRAEVKAVHGAWDTAEQELDPGDRRARRLQRDAEPGRGLLRDRRHPAAARRLRRRRGRPARGARARASPPSPPWRSSASRRARPRRRSRRSTPRRRDGLGPLDAQPAAAGAGGDRGGRRRRRARSGGRRRARRP